MATLVLTRSIPPGRRLLRDWFDSLEDTLRQDAKAKGLLGHPSMIGAAREFVIKRVLGSFLPPALHVGSGRIVANEAAASPQVDVVVFDPRFPYLRTDDGQALYPVEGVIATIEVKSELSKSHLLDALGKCVAVASLPVGIITADLEAEMRRVEWYSHNPTVVTNAIAKALLPKTYIYGLSGISTIETLSDHVRDWFQGVASGEGRLPSLPSMIITDKCLGLNLTEKILMRDVQRSVGPDGQERDPNSMVNLMGYWETPRQFGLLATHLLDAIHDRERSQRIGHVRLGYADYFPFHEYFRDYLSDRRWISLTREQSGYTTKTEPTVEQNSTLRESTLVGHE